MLLRENGAAAVAAATVDSSQKTILQDFTAVKRLNCNTHILSFFVFQDKFPTLGASAAS